MMYDFRKAKHNVIALCVVLVLAVCLVAQNGTSPTASAQDGSSSCQTKHTIVKGNTVWGISHAYKVSMDSIVACNKWSDGITHLILPGQVILLPGQISVQVTIPTLPISSDFYYQHPNPNVERWHTIAIQAGWSEKDWKAVSCIMQHPVYTNVAESSGIPDLHVNRGGDNSYGLLMLNTKGSLWNWYKQYISSRDQLLDPYTNLHVAKILSDYTASAKWAHHDRWFAWRSTQKRATCFL